MDGVQLSERYEARLGCPPLIRVNGKCPLDLQWSSGPRQDPDGWRAKLEDHHGNVGLVTGGGICVVDADFYNVGAEDALDDLYDIGLPRETLTVLTGRGGRHLYYRSPVPIASRPLAGYPGIDIKGEGGQVVCPPSLHSETGRAYEWEDGYGPDDDCPIALLPEHLIELFAGDTTSAFERGEGDLDERDEEAVNLLLDHFGAHAPQQRDGYVELTRPGKERGVSATVGYIGRGATKVWSSNWPGLPAGVYGLSELRKRAGVPGPTFTIPDSSLTSFPPGYRLWEQGDDHIPDPVLDRAAYHGPVGDYLDLLDGQTEAHPAAVGLLTLASVGTLIGRRACYRAGRILHHANLFVAIVGPTSEGAKGVADGEVLALLKPFAPSFLACHSIGGAGSGEVIVRDLADGQKDADGKEKPTERRRIVFDAELSHVLKVAKRDGSILGEILRKLFDYHPLRHSTVMGGTVTASNHHVAIAGSITPEELRSLMDELSIANGLGNRLLYGWSRYAALLPYGGDVDQGALADVAARIEAALETLDGHRAINGTTDYRLDPAARETWEQFYLARRRGAGEGIARALNSRHVAHAARLALICAVLDGGVPVIRGVHVDAAIAWCNYSRDTVDKVFVGGVGGKAGKLLQAVRDAMPDGLYGRTLNKGVAHNWKAGDLTEARQRLEDLHLLHVISEENTGGRPRDRYVALAHLGR